MKRKDGNLIVYKYLPIYEGRCKLIGVSHCPDCHYDDYVYSYGDHDYRGYNYGNGFSDNGGNNSTNVDGSSATGYMASPVPEGRRDNLSGDHGGRGRGRHGRHIDRN